MKKPRRKSRGSITVLVTLILVPTIFFMSFMVDLARLKLYGNQAVMTADNYGEAVLTQYDNILKELYGLFAVTQNTEGKEALDTLQEYMKTSFNPTSNTISWGHLTSVLSSTSYSGFMPYSSAEVSLSYTAADNANLGNSDVLRTQVGDFMKFRIVQALYDGDDEESGILDMVTSVQNAANDAKAVDQRNDLTEAAEDLMEAAENYYTVLKVIKGYPDYITGINRAYSDAETAFLNITGSAAYLAYINYIRNREDIEAAQARQAALEEGESLSEEDQDLIDIYDTYCNTEGADASSLKSRFQDAIDDFKDSRDSEPVDFDNFDSIVTGLKEATASVKDKLERVQELRTELEATLNSNDISASVKQGIQEELDSLDELFNVNGSYSAANYVGLKDYIVANNPTTNGEYKQQTNEMAERMEDIADAYIDDEEPEDWLAILDKNEWDHFYSSATPKYVTLYDSLDTCFGGSGDENEANQKKKEANKLQEENEASLPENESSDARDIPSDFNMGKSTGSDSFAITRLIKT
ncbi:MAG: hypothetical protein LUH19_09270, partial [Lachnospiraceae bacterium]|nr:hypothetical protein [Lachnospiraceae bacterium]